MARTKDTRSKARRAKPHATLERVPSILVDASRPMLTVRDWAKNRNDGDAHDAAVYELPYVRHIELVRETGFRIDWWSVEPGAFDYWHQAEEVGRTFFEETGRQFLEHGEPIEHALKCALNKIGGHTRTGVWVWFRCNVGSLRAHRVRLAKRKCASGRVEMTPVEYLDDILSRRYSVVCLNADRQLAAAARAADRAVILERAGREMELIRHCESVIHACGLRGAANG